ncbi:MAG: hypothetical protein JWM28_4118 [Chitinophagaceae bacterium]|nr:hypothetical protein [Chitinophagaceae bacterium]
MRFLLQVNPVLLTGIYASSTKVVGKLIVS